MLVLVMVCVEMAVRGASRRRRSGEDFGMDAASSAEATDRALSLIDELEEAARSDASNVSRGRVATAKLQMLPKLEAAMRNASMISTYLTHGVLRALRLWLDPLPDGSLPNLTIRTALLRILSALPVDLVYPHLRESRIGMSIFATWKRESEPTANRRMAQTLIEQWSRPIFGLSADYKDRMEYSDDIAAQEREAASQRRKSLASSTGAAPAASSASAASGVRTAGLSSPSFLQRKQASSAPLTRPQALLDYVVPPPSAVERDKLRRNSGRAMDRRIRQLARKAVS